MKKLSTQHGFTIIETLVAITILMISIAGPLTIANKSYQAAVLAHDQLTASFLAQDELEYVKNFRDDNIINTSATRSWLSYLSNCIASNPCSADTLNGVPLSGTGIINCGAFCVLHKDSYGYNYDVSKPPTQFSRYFYIKPSANPDEVTLVVVVTWNNGLVPNQVEYDNELFNVLK